MSVSPLLRRNHGVYSAPRKITLQAMESITAKINAIFNNENDAWQEMTLEVRALLLSLRA